MDAGTVRQAGVEDRVFLGDFAANPLGDIVDGGQQGIFAGEAGIGANQLPAAFHVDAIIAIDHDFADRLVGQEGTDRLKKVADAGFKDRLAGHGVSFAASGSRVRTPFVRSLFRCLYLPTTWGQMSRAEVGIASPGRPSPAASSGLSGTFPPKGVAMQQNATKCGTFSAIVPRVNDRSLPAWSIPKPPRRGQWPK